MAPSRLELLAWVAVSIGVAAAVFAAQTPDILGLFHDDGVYAATAKSLVEHGQYTVSSVPGEPFQTKYPPVYSLLLAMMWQVAPSFPDNVVWLKGVNVGLVAIMVFGFAYLGKRALPREHVVTPVLLLLLLGTTPGVVTFADYTMSDVLFLTLVVWVLVAPGVASGLPRLSSHALVAMLTATAILSRSVGICLAAAVVLDSLMSQDVRRAVLHASAMGAVFGVWYVWGMVVGGSSSPLVGYYQAYETSAFGYLGTDPALAARIVLGNLRMAAAGAGAVLGPSFGVWPALVVLVGMGVPVLWRGGQRLALIFSVVYIGIVLSHPFAPHRYLVALLPVFYLSVLAGARAVAELVDRALLRWRTFHAARAAVLATAVFLLVGNLAWIQYILTPSPSGTVRGWYGVDFGYRWDGFEETFGWIRDNTAADDRLGSIFDPMYYLYTGRQAIRPWLHRPETYFYPYGRNDPFVGRPADVARELRALGITYIVLDPPAGYAEGEAATLMLQDLLRLSEVNSSLVFRSGDGAHEVYRLSWRDDSS